MEDGLDINPMGSQGTLVVKTDTNTNNDLMLRRLKNRERQRRYRARKRLEADNQKSYISSQSTAPQLALQPNVIPINAIRRVYCQRDWKKDARRAHACKVQEQTPNVAAESQTLTSSSGIKVEGLQDGREPPSENRPTKTKVVKRDWKAEARNKADP